MTEKNPHCGARGGHAYHHGDLANALVRAATEMVGARGAGALTLRAVAHRAGVSPAAVYRHFRNRSALLEAVAAEGFAALREAFARVLAEEAGAEPRRRLGALGEAYVAFALSRPHLYSLMLGPDRPPSLAAPRLDGGDGTATTFTLFRSTLAACLGADADTTTVARLAIASWSLVHGYVALRLRGLLDGAPAEALADTGAIIGSLAIACPPNGSGGGRPA